MCYNGFISKHTGVATFDPEHKKYAWKRSAYYINNSNVFIFIFTEAIYSLDHRHAQENPVTATHTITKSLTAVVLLCVLLELITSI